MNASRYTQIGVELSLQSGKTRSYLRHKRIPFVDRPTDPRELFFTVPRRTRALAVPVVIAPEGEWLQDSSAIIDEMVLFIAECVRELRHTPVVAEGSRKAIRHRGEIRYPLAGGMHRQTGLSYPVWTARRPLSASGNN